MKEDKEIKEAADWAWSRIDEEEERVESLRALMNSPTALEAFTAFLERPELEHAMREWLETEPPSLSLQAYQEWVEANPVLNGGSADQGPIFLPAVESFVSMAGTWEAAVGCGLWNRRLERKEVLKAERPWWGRDVIETPSEAPPLKVLPDIPDECFELDILEERFESGEIEDPMSNLHVEVDDTTSVIASGDAACAADLRFWEDDLPGFVRLLTSTPLVSGRFPLIKGYYPSYEMQMEHWEILGIPEERRIVALPPPEHLPSFADHLCSLQEGHEGAHAALLGTDFDHRRWFMEWEMVGARTFWRFRSQPQCLHFDGLRRLDMPSLVRVCTLLQGHGGEHRFDDYLPSVTSVGDYGYTNRQDVWMRLLRQADSALGFDVEVPTTEGAEGEIERRGLTT